MNQLFIVKLTGSCFSYEKYVVAKTRQAAEEKAKKRFKYSVVRVIDELGEVL